MIAPGLTSVTFRNLTPQEIVNLASEAGLMGIEWGGDIHLPPGQMDQATEINKLTRDAGLYVAAYGSYYTVGKNKEAGTRFEEVLQTSMALGAPLIRIWAGDRGSRESTAGYRRKVLEETRKMAEDAGQLGIRLAFEFHENTLNDSYDSCYDLLTDLNHSEVKTYWQPIHGAGPDINGAGIDKILPWIAGVHVFHWWPSVEVRLPLRQGAGDWASYIHLLSGGAKTIFGNLEFVKDDSTEQFFEDAATLLELTGNQLNWQT